MKWVFILSAIILGTVLGPLVSASDTDRKFVFIGNTYTGPSKGADPDKPAILDFVVKLTEGGIEPSFIRASPVRGWQELKARKNVCVFPKIQTPERFEFSYFSRLPISVYPPRRLYVHASVARRLEGMTSLKDILATGNIQVGISEGANYGKHIMPLVSLFPDRFFILTSHADFETTLDNMLASGRIDGILRAGALDWAGHERFTPIAIEEADPALFGHVICSKTPQGKYAIEQIDLAMKHPSFRRFIVAQHLKAFPASEHAFLRGQLDTLFAQ